MVTWCKSNSVAISWTIWRKTSLCSRQSHISSHLFILVINKYLTWRFPHLEVVCALYLCACVLGGKWEASKLSPTSDRLSLSSSSSFRSRCCYCCCIEEVGRRCCAELLSMVTLKGAVEQQLWMRLAHKREEQLLLRVGSHTRNSYFLTTMTSTVDLALFFS